MSKFIGKFNIFTRSCILFPFLFDFYRELKSLAETLKRDSDDSSLERKLNKLQHQVSILFMIFYVSTLIRFLPDKQRYRYIGPQYGN